MNSLSRTILAICIAEMTVVSAFSSEIQEPSVVQSANASYSESASVSEYAIPTEAAVTMRRPRIGLTFAGGGAKGAAHIGVLKVLEEVGIPIDYITGTSMGSIIGMLYSLGYSANQMDSIISSINWGVYMSDRMDRRYTNSVKAERQGKSLVSLSFNTGNFSHKMTSLEEDQEITEGKKHNVEKEARAGQNESGLSFLSSLPGGFTTGSNLLNLFNCLSVGYQDSMDFNDLPIPYACVVSDVVSGGPKVLRSGRLPEAVRASMAIPGVFAPVRYGKDMTLVDGGLFNNFPVDVCQQMGADIVIGVEVTKERGEINPDAINSLPELLTRLFDMMTRKGTYENQQRCTIYIHPDISGFGTLSFSEENVKAIIDRGYQAASEKREMLEALRAQLDKYPKEEIRKAPPAKNVSPFSKTEVKISDLNVDGMDETIENRMIQKAKVDFSRPVTGKDLDRLVGLIYGTGAFKRINYYLKPQADGTYFLDIKTAPAEPHSAAIGFRFDSQDFASILFHLGLGENKMTGWKGSTTWNLGLNLKGNVTVSYSPKIFPTVNLALNYWVNSNQMTTVGIPISKSTKKEYNAELYVSQFHSKYIQAEGGLSLQSRRMQSVFYGEEYVTRNIKSVTEETKQTIIDGFEDLEGKTENVPLSLFFRMKYDDLDRETFATHGIRFQVFADWYFAELDRRVHEDGINNPHLGDVQLNFESFIPIGKNLVVKPQLYTRCLIGCDAGNYHYLPYYNYMGGAKAGRYVQQQLPFIGMNSVESLMDLAAILRGDLQWNISGRHYLTGMFNYCRECDDFSSLFDGDNGLNHFGAGIEYAYNSIIGPLSLDIHWSNIRSDASFGDQLGLYLNIGYNF